MNHILINIKSILLVVMDTNVHAVSLHTNIEVKVQFTNMLRKSLKKLNSENQTL